MSFYKDSLIAGPIWGFPESSMCPLQTACVSGSFDALKIFWMNERNLLQCPYTHKTSKTTSNILETPIK